VAEPGNAKLQRQLGNALTSVGFALWQQGNIDGAQDNIAKALAIDQKLEVLLGAAPPAKVLYGSDEASEPEVIWLSAQIGREALGRVLASAVERRWLDEREARTIGEGVLAGNARRLHGI